MKPKLYIWGKKTTEALEKKKKAQPHFLKEGSNPRQEFNLKRISKVLMQQKASHPCLKQEHKTTFLLYFTKEKNTLI